MKRLLAILALVFTAACSHEGGGGSITAPSAAFSTVASSGASMRTKSVVGDPTPSGVVFATDQLGKVTVTNNGTAAHRFAFYVWDASDVDNQQMKARFESLIAAGQTSVLTVAFEQVCGTKYQRDVYLDIPDYQGATSEAETRNYFFAAPGVYWQSEVGNCDTPVVVPPVTHEDPPATCQNQDANNYGGLLPCTFGEGVIIVEDPPPSVVDLCPNVEGIQLTLPCTTEPPPPQKFLFCHVDVNVTNKGKVIVHEQQVGGQNGIPLTAIQNGHTANGPAPFAEHALDYYGTCDGRGNNLGQQ